MKGHPLWNIIWTILCFWHWHWQYWNKTGRKTVQKQIQKSEYNKKYCNVPNLNLISLGNMANFWALKKQTFVCSLKIFLIVCSDFETLYQALDPAFHSFMNYESMYSEFWILFVVFHLSFVIAFLFPFPFCHFTLQLTNFNFKDMSWLTSPKFRGQRLHQFLKTEELQTVMSANSPLFISMLATSN